MKEQQEIKNTNKVANNSMIKKALRNNSLAKKDQGDNEDKEMEDEEEERDIDVEYET